MKMGTWFALSGVSGVGRRIASRIVLELKGKLELDSGSGSGPARY